MQYEFIVTSLTPFMSLQSHKQQSAGSLVSTAVLGKGFQKGTNVKKYSNCIL